jgi:hypothetical protein
MKEQSKRLREWFSYNDYFLNGTIDMMTLRGESNPRVGERIEFAGLEFYLEQAVHGWTYGGPMTANLTLTRGANYLRGIPKTYKDISDQMVAVTKYIMDETAVSASREREILNVANPGSRRGMKEE